MLMPTKRRPKPIKIFPIFLESVFLVAISSIIPISTATGAISEKFRAISTEVTVVPMLAPIITPTACVSDIMPALTKPTTITVVADDDWMTAVTRNPTNTARNLLLVMTSSRRLSFEPAAFSSPSPIVRMPNRNSPIPPASDRIFVMLT